MQRSIVTRAGFFAAGTLFAIYPATRPWADKTGGDAADAFASPAWPLAHTAAMLGFISLALALRAVPRGADRASQLRDPRRAESRAWIAVAFLGPYFGAEAFGLHALGQRALEIGDSGVTQVADGFRSAPVPLALFALGLLALGLVGGRLLALTRAGGRLERLGGALAGVGLLTFLPQFFLPPVGRVAHGILLGAGLVLLACIRDRRATVAGDARASASALVS